MSRLWKRIICMSLILTMLVPGQAAFAAEMPAELPVETEAVEEETVAEESTEEAVTEEAAEEAVPEEGMEEEVVTEEAAEEAVPEEGMEEEAVTEEAAEEAVPEEGMEEETVTEEETVEEVVMEEVTAEDAAMAATAGTWEQDDNGWKYKKADGSYAEGEVLEISGKWYGFDYDGYMYDDEEFWNSGYDQATGEYVSGYYRAKAGGVLYVNEWYKEDWGDWYYYGERGLAPEGFTAVGGVNYYFYYGGRMAADAAITQDGISYIMDSSGHAVKVTKDGWHQVSGKYYYRQNGTFLADGVYKINGVLYGFAYQGLMYDDEYFHARTYDGSSYAYHRAKAGGSLCVNEWYQDEYDNWYYYGANGVAARGFTTINGVNYYFYSDGQMAVNTTVTSGGVDYLVDADGIAIKVDKDGWYSVSGEWYYRQDGEFLSYGIYTIKNVRYGFDYSGRMYDNEDFWMDDAYYRAKKGGSLYVNEWYQDEYGDWYYYDTEGKAPEYEIRTVNGTQYYFQWYGRMAVNQMVSYNEKLYKCDASGVCSLLPNGWSQHNPYGYENFWYYTENGSVVNGVKNIGGSYYVFRESRMLTPSYDGFIENEEYLYLAADQSGRIVAKTGWNVYDGNYYYINSDCSLYMGLLSSGGKQYYCRPEMAYSEMVSVGGNSYLADSTGALTKVTKDGLYHTADGTVYISGAAMLKNAWKNVDGRYYYFDDQGIAYSNCTAYIDGKRYAFREDGVMVVNSFFTWDKYSEGTCYAGATGELVTGEQQIAGKWYYFDEYGEMLSSIAEYGNGYGIYAANGEYLGTLSGNGWKKLNGSYYYISNGKLVRDEKKTISGADYIFDEDGTMRENVVTNWEGERYYCGEGGAVQKNGWKWFNGSYYYAKADGSLYRNGIYKINGTEYYFYNSGKMADCDFVLNGTLYKVTSGGAVKSKTASATVTLTEGANVYFVNGLAYTGWKNGKYYDEGRIAASGAAFCGDGYYAFDKNGNYLKNTWYNLKNTDVWMYLKADGKAACNETLKIGGYTYCFEEYMMVADRVYQGHYYDAKGHQAGTISGSGWKQAGKNWYYLVNGVPVKSRLLEINGNTYGFAYDGRMISGYIGYVNGKSYYFNGSGILQKYTGWQKIYGSWYYFAKDYSCFEGWINDGGKQYYCDYDGMATGVHLISGKLYNFGTNGVLQNSYKAKDGWLQVSEGWCYVQNGKPLSDGLYKIGSSWYSFEETGIMEANQPTDYGYATSSGALITSRGWHKLNNGEWIYIGTGNVVYRSGSYYIGGTLYVFDGNGHMI